MNAINSMNTPNSKQRVLVIGLDGATLEIIKPLALAGKLPNFTRMMSEGSYGPLKSTFPPITPCAWTSFTTGKDPSKHGLYDFSLHQGDPEHKKDVNRTFVKAKSLWRILSERGKKSIVIDVPLTYPPEDINGILISRIMSPAKKNCTYPKSLYPTLCKKGFISKVKREIAPEHGAEKAHKKSQRERKTRRLSKAKLKKLIKQRINRIFQQTREEINKNVELAQWLMQKQDWDFLMLVFMSTDSTSHAFWHHQAKVKKIYEKLDAAIGELFASAGKDVIKFIISDHGFTSVPYAFNINEWLYTKGLLFKKLDIPDKKDLQALRKFLKKIRKKKAKRLPSQKKNRLKKFRYLISTDYAKSKAYLQSGTAYGVRINLADRDKTGIVKKEDYELFRDGLIKEFKKIKHPLTKEKIFSQVLKKEDVYSPHSGDIDPAPDIFLLPLDMRVMLQGHFQPKSPKFKIFARTPQGYGFHHLQGIFFTQGEGIKNTSLNSPKITDLAPTILHILDIPIPEDMDGRVLKEIFAQDSSFARRKIQSQGPSVIEKKEEKIYSARDEEEIRARLRALGYVG